MPTTPQVVLYSMATRYYEIDGRPACPNDGCHTLLSGRSYSVCRTCTKKRKPGTKRKSRAFSRHASTRLNKRNRKSSVHRGELVARGQPREPPRGPKSKGTSTSKTTKKANGTINKAKSKFPIQPHKCATRSSREGGGFI